jgi:pimeloyl-ACP methyl ester carboxylesterase
MPLPLVYVHGFIGHLKFPELFTGMDPAWVLSPDLIGYGAYAGHRPPAVAEQVTHLETLVRRAFGEQPVVLAGHSGGMPVCIRFAERWPERVAGLISAEGNLAPSDAFLSSRLAPMAPARIQEWLERAQADPAAFLAQEHLRGDPLQVQRVREWLDYQPATAIHAMARALLVETVHPGYATAVMRVMAQTPTYLIQGELSGSALGVPTRLAAMAVNTHLMRGVGHLMVLEDPDAFARIVASIVGALEVPPAPAFAMARD